MRPICDLSFLCEIEYVLPLLPMYDASDVSGYFLSVAVLRTSKLLQGRLHDQGFQSLKAL